MEKANLVVLIESDPQACAYFTHLPQSVRDQISQDPQGISSLDSLRARAGYLMSQTR